MHDLNSVLAKQPLICAEAIFTYVSDRPQQTPCIPDFDCPFTVIGILHTNVASGVIFYISKIVGVLVDTREEVNVSGFAS
jgi:hypothetical protein